MNNGNHHCNRRPHPILLCLSCVVPFRKTKPAPNEGGGTLTAEGSPALTIPVRFCPLNRQSRSEDVPRADPSRIPNSAFRLPQSAVYLPPSFRRFRSDGFHVHPGSAFRLPNSAFPIRQADITGLLFATCALRHTQRPLIWTSVLVDACSRPQVHPVMDSDTAHSAGALDTKWSTARQSPSKSGFFDSKWLDF